MSKRSNEEWLSALHSPEGQEALSELRSLLLSGVRAALRGRTGFLDSAAEDLVQEALIKILGSLDSFRGECRFTTWASKIAIRTAFAEMRHRRWHDVPLDDAIARGVWDDATLYDPLADPERVAARTLLMAQFRRFIDEELTETQRRALLATMGGMPLEEVARRLGTNRNALYKLLHDARKKLKRRMKAERLSPQDVLAVFNSP